MQEIKRVLATVKPIHPALGMILVLATLEALLGSAIPWLYREVINFLTLGELSGWFGRFVPQNNGVVFTLMVLVSLYVGVLFIEDVFARVRIYIENMTRLRSWYLMREAVLNKLQALSMPFFYRNSPGALAEKINSGIRETFPVVQIVLVEIWPTIFKFFVAVIAISFINKWIAMGLAVVMVGYGALSVWRSRINKKAEEHYRKQVEENGRVWINAISYQELIKQFAREEDMVAELALIFRELFRVQKARYILTSWIDIAQELMWKVVVFFVYGYGGYLVLTQKSLTVGDLILFVSYMDRAMSPLSYVLRLYDQMQTGLVSIRRMLTVWDTPIDVKDIEGAKDIVTTKGEVELKNITFYYRDNKGKKQKEPVFKNFSLKIKSGETVALVGPSGAGKSTLVKLLLRFYDPDQGTVMIDGQDISKVTQKSVRRNVTAIMQDVVVFNDTIRKNLQYAKKNAKPADMERSLQMASLRDFVFRLPKKLNTVLGERGLRLSGGERQRLGLARALLKDAPIVVMDEATSALDSENEKKIQDAIENLISNKTTIVIAHRLSTVKRADRIVVINKGRLVEQGTHNQLVKKKNGYYKKLYMMQGVLLRD